jgi:hypothetical protein
MRDRTEFQWWDTDRSVSFRNFSTEYAVYDTGFGESSRPVRFPPPLTHCKPEIRSLNGPFFFLFQSGLARLSDFRRLVFPPKSVSDRPWSLSIRPSPESRRIQNIYILQCVGEMGLRRGCSGFVRSRSKQRHPKAALLCGAMRKIEWFGSYLVGSQPDTGRGS